MVLTRAAEPIIVALGGKVTIFPVIATGRSRTGVDAAHIMDTSGAGDAFVGGFLACWVMNYDGGEMVGGSGYSDLGELTAECVRVGIAASQYVIQRVGCALPEPTDVV